MPTAEYMRNYRKANPEKAKVWSDRSNEGRPPIERAAHDAVKNALKNGTLIQEPCEVCEDPNSEAHHDDYTKPLDVRWFCKSDHKAWHKDHDVVQNETPLFPGFETEYKEKTPLAGLHPRIQEMHRKHKSTEGKKCGDCVWLGAEEHPNGWQRLFKCSKYKTNKAASQDWRKSWPACGLFEKEKK